MSAALLTPLEAYLSKSFEPDCEYIDGRLVERHVGEYYHSILQSLLATHINNLRLQYGPKFRAFTEQRMRVSAQRYRIPDVCVLESGHKKTPVIMEPPVLTVEILSIDDSLVETVQKCQDYVVFGVPHIWIADPRLRTICEVSSSGDHPVPNKVATFTAAGFQVEIDFNAIFAEMDRD